MEQIIAPVMIACRKRYTKMAVISVGSFLKTHKNICLYVAADDDGRQMLSKFECDQLCIVDVKKPLQIAKSQVKSKNFEIIDYDNDGRHDRAFSALKPLIMEAVVKEKFPEAKYILSLDVDSVFTGNVLKRTMGYLNSVNHKYDLYMVTRDDSRMQCLGSREPGSGFTLWKRSSQFTKMFAENFNDSCTGKKGGSQTLIYRIRQFLKYNEINDPFLHFVSPDLAKPPLPDEEISKFKPAYIHIHGLNSYKRLLRINGLFYP